jgi:hypothetical protein
MHDVVFNTISFRESQTARRRWSRLADLGEILVLSARNRRSTRRPTQAPAAQPGLRPTGRRCVPADVDRAGQVREDSNWNWQKKVP